MINSKTQKEEEEGAVMSEEHLKNCLVKMKDKLIHKHCKWLYDNFVSPVSSVGLEPHL